MTNAVLLDQLQSGERVNWKSIGKLDELGKDYFSRLIAFYGSDNAQLNILGRHWKSVAQHSADPAWAYRAGGVYERLHARWQESAEAFITAGKKADNDVDRLSFQVGAIDSLARAGKISAADKLASKIHGGLRKLDEPALAARALLNLGNAYVYRDDMPNARRALSKAVPELAPLEAASALTALSSTHIFGGTPRLAESLANQAITQAEDIGADYLASLARLNLALVWTLTNRSEYAFLLLQNLVPEFEDSGFDLARVEEYLGDALHNLNLESEAIEHYTNALSSGSQTVALHKANIHLGLASAHLSLKNWEKSGNEARSAREIYRQIGNRPWEAFSILLMCQAGALTRRSLLRALTLSENSPYIHARVLLELAVDRPEHIKSAYRLVRKMGYTDLRWKLDYLEAKHSKSPLPAYRKMLKWILLDRAAKGSVAGTSNALNDKSEAVAEYLDILLTRGTAKDIREARRVIESLRSATLLDEIISGSALNEESISRLERLSADLTQIQSDQPKGTRAGETAAPEILRKGSILAAELLLESRLSHSDAPLPPTETNIIWSGQNSFALITKEDAKFLHKTPAQVENLIRWLNFELVGAQAKSADSAKEAARIICQLATAFAPLWESGDSFICPEGAAWGVPWSACAAITGDERAWQLALHPSMRQTLDPTATPLNSALIIVGDRTGLETADKEIEQIGTSYRDVKVADSRQLLLKEFGKSYDVVHVVGHAVHRERNPMLSAIQMEDGPVFAFEISRSGLKTELATLSACETGMISGAVRWEPDGLARAFLACGAQGVVASQWELDDGAALLMFGTLHAELAKKSSLENAFLESQCICRRNYLHPYYWGSLALYSGYSK